MVSKPGRGAAQSWTIACSCGGRLASRLGGRFDLADRTPQNSAVSLADDPTVVELIALARREDLGTGDITSLLLPAPDQPARLRLIARQPGVFAGREIAEAVAAAYDPRIAIRWADIGRDGARWHRAPAELAEFTGPLAALLAAERVVLNFLQRLCGVATRTRAFVDAVAGTAGRIYDTRKTIPAWRVLDKYAVRCGGGLNHRLGLHDAVLIKDNHLAGVSDDRLAYAVFDMLNRLSQQGGPAPQFVQVECAGLAQLAELLKVTGIDSILLDNFSVDALRQAVALRDDLGLAGKVALEASGGVSLDNVRAIAETGVDRISVGSITHSAAALDLALDRI
jgi:nicotinate-nucleotide pyrophosphorylase (carboxylating)